MKTETAQPPLFGIGVRKVTPADMYTWRGPEVEITGSSPRIPAERNWYAVTGRVIRVQVEDDGDLHSWPDLLISARRCTAFHVSTSVDSEL